MRQNHQIPFSRVMTLLPQQHFLGHINMLLKGSSEHVTDESRRCFLSFIMDWWKLVLCEKYIFEVGQSDLRIMKSAD